MEKCIIVGIGAALGGVSRYWLSGFVFRFLPATFPFGTLAVNFIGSFIIGLVLFGFNDKEVISPAMKLFLTVGFCGGFTTFSTFSFETIALLKESNYWFAFLNIMLSVLLSLGGTFLGYILPSFVRNSL